MARRYYSSTAARTTLAADINSSVTTVGVNAVTGWPASFPYTIIIDQDTINEEVVEVTARVGTTLTVTRGVDGTTGVAHSAGAAVNHGVSARDFDEPNIHINATTSVHGISDTSVLLTASSTNTLTNKTISGSSNTLSNIAQSSVTNLATDLADKTSYGLFAKADINSVAFTKTGNGTVSIKAGTYVQVGASLITFSSATAVTMPSLSAGTDYYVYVTNVGGIQAVAATGTWPTPVASPPANSRLIGGFHYAPGGNAAARAGGNTTAQINEFSLWDLKWKPAALDPRGMTLVNNHFWSDIYLCNTSHATVGTSRNAQTIYDTATWWDMNEVLGLYGKRPPRYREYADLAFGTTEAVSRGNDPVTTGLGTTNAGSSQADQVFTSKWGVIQSSGCLWVWGDEFGGGTGTAAWTANTGGRGSTYQLENAALVGGAWFESAISGSRSSFWLNSPTLTYSGLGARGVCNHLNLP